MLAAYLVYDAKPVGARLARDEGIPFNIKPGIAPVGQGTKITQLWHPGPAAL
jgi:hypothetical protein